MPGYCANFMFEGTSSVFFQTWFRRFRSRPMSSVTQKVERVSFWSAMSVRAGGVRLNSQTTPEERSKGLEGGAYFSVTSVTFEEC